MGREGGRKGGEANGGVADEAHCAVSHNMTEVGPTGSNHHLPARSAAFQAVTSLTARLDKSAVSVK